MELHFVHFKITSEAFHQEMDRENGQEIKLFLFFAFVLI